MLPTSIPTDLTKSGFENCSNPSSNKVCCIRQHNLNDSIIRSDIRNLKILTQIFTGHSTLQRHLEVMKIIPDGTCEQCYEEDETVEHFITDCMAFCHPRREVFGTWFLKQEEMKDLEPDKLLKYVRLTKRWEI